MEKKYKIKSDKVNEITEALNDLEKLLTERISDLHDVKGGMQARHAYCYYRQLLWSAKYSLRDNLTINKTNNE